MELKRVTKDGAVASVIMEVIGQEEFVNQINMDLLRLIVDAAEVMVRKNTERGDCWREVGMLGGFIEVHTCYHRLRELLWNRDPMMEDARWREDILNACQDLRNFTILIELALVANLYAGDAMVNLLRCPNCGIARGIL